MDAISVISQNLLNMRNALQMVATLNMASHLYYKQSAVDDGDKFHFIICGGGSAGSVLASRLSENPKANVLLIEAGGDPQPEIEFPGLLSYSKLSNMDWNILTPENHNRCIKDNISQITQGKVLGGTSCLNYMIYVRGDKSVYNEWAEKTNDSSWRYENVLNYFKKSENCKIPELMNSSYSIFHGSDGYLGITKLTSSIDFPMSNGYLKAFEELGHDLLPDGNTDQILGYSIPQLTALDGVRQYTARSFLSHATNRPNLHILKNTKVIKIIIDQNKVARGVTIIDSAGNALNLYAEREVIISAGSLHTPQLLMLSGVGPEKHLRDFNVDTLMNLPVGENLHNHQPTMLVFTIPGANRFQQNFSKPFDPRKYPIPIIHGFGAINKTDNHPLYHNHMFFVDRTSFLTFCSIEYRWDDSVCLKFYDVSEGKSLIISLIYLCKPMCRGHVHLQSTDHRDSPKINAPPFCNGDFENMVSSLMDVARVVSTEYFKEIGAELLELPSCSSFSSGSREYYECYARCVWSMVFHWAGSCAMGAVVDSKLRVLGIKNLRVTDASVMPNISSGNTNAPTIMIAEKSADIIKEDHHDIYN